MSRRSRGAMKRLRRDAQYLMDHPIVGANAAPTEDNIFVWHLNFNISFDLDNQTYNIPLHAILEAPTDYPSNPPNVGFCTRFPYRMGASYVDSKPGPLNGTLVLCLNILGNFAHVHTEWKNLEGQGWSPSMSIETVLIQLQTMLMDLNLSTAEKRELLRKTQAYSCMIDEDEGLRHTFDNPWPVLYTAEQIEARRHRNQFITHITTTLQDDMCVQNITHLLEILANQQAQQLQDIGTCTEVVTPFMNIITTLTNLVQTQRTTKKPAAVAAGPGAAEASAENVQMEIEEEPQTSYEDETIVCYCSHVNYLEDILGYGVLIDKKNVKTPGELLSYTSFAEDEIRQSTTKKRFEFWIPAFINQTHVHHDRWYTLACESLKLIASTMQENAKQFTRNSQQVKKVHPILDVLPNLINSMIVEIMKGDRAAAIAYFESLCSFWRMLRWFLFESPKADILRKQAMDRLKRFCVSPPGRHKDVVPDVGQLLALYTCLTDQIQESVFVDGYLDESMRRSTMWWLDNIGAHNITANKVFVETKVGRDIFMFQLTVMRELLENDPENTCVLMDQSCGKLPQKLENLQKRWKQIQPSIENWNQYLQFVGISRNSVYYNTDMNAIVKKLPAICESLGPKYMKRKRKNNNNNNYRGGYRNNNNYNQRRNNGRYQNNNEDYNRRNGRRYNDDYDRQDRRRYNDDYDRRDRRRY